LCHLYERDHLMLLLFTFAFTLVFGDAVKLIWGSDYRSFSTAVFRAGSGCVRDLFLSAV